MMLGFVAVVLCALFLYVGLNDAVRARVEEVFARHYSRLRVRVRSARWVQGRGIEIRGLTIEEPGADGPRADLLQVPEAFLTCRGDWEELASGKPQIRQITLRGATLRITRRRDGTWSASRLWPLPSLGPNPPVVVVEQATVEVFDPAKQPSGIFILRNVQLTIRPQQRIAGSGTAVSALPRNEAGAVGRNGSVRIISGSFTGDYLERGELQGTIDVASGTWNVQGTVQRLELSPELCQSLPRECEAQLASLGSLRGEVDLGFEVASTGTEAGCRFALHGNITQGRYEDSRLAHSVSDINGRFRLDWQGFRLEDLSATVGRATVWVKRFQSSGSNLQGPWHLEARVRQLELEPYLTRLHPQLADLWSTFQPSGKVNADLAVGYDGRKWQAEVAVQALGVSFRYRKFPYPVQQATGWLVWEGDRLQVDLTARAGNRPVRIQGRVIDPTGQRQFKFSAFGTGLVFDEALVQALEAKPRKVVAAFHPQGRFDFEAEVQGQAGSSRTKLTLTLNNCSVCYDRFPYPVSNLCGTVLMESDDAGTRWQFRDMKGTNDTGRLNFGGQVIPTANGNRVLLAIHGEQIALEDELRDALGRPSLRKLWNSLRLRGMLQRIDAEVSYLTADSSLSITFRAVPDAETTSVEPVWFPYRMEKLRGELVYRDGVLTVERLDAENDESRFSTSLQCRFAPEGQWEMVLDRLFAEQIPLNRRLLQALPEHLQRIVTALNPTGPINLHGTLSFARAAGSNAPVTSQWNVGIDFHQTRADVGLRVENLNGGVQLAGSYDGATFQCLGELDIDSLTYKQVQLTQLRGPFRFDGSRLLLGVLVQYAGAGGSGAAPKPTGADPRPITARLFDGILSGNGWVQLGEVPEYRLQVSLSRADLAVAARDLLTTTKHLTGKAYARIDLAGRGRSVNQLSGAGRLQLVDANIYELPLMIALLKLLSIREPDPTAFSSADVAFRIRGDQLELTHITFSGDAISLEGRGEMDLEGRIGLVFRALLGRAEWQLPLVRELVGGASEQIVTIHVAGTLQNPIVRNEPFPMVNQMLQQFQSGANRSWPSSGLLPPGAGLMGRPQPR